MDTFPIIPTYILVHGAWHGAWCWRSVVPLLARTGAQVLAPDLPGHGQDRTPPDQVTFRGYIERVRATVEQARGPVILVGHSLGGQVITQVAEECANQIARLVYLTALLPRDGESAMDAIAAQQDALTPQGWEMTEQGIRLLPEEAPALFYHDCSRDDIAFALRHLCLQAYEPLEAPVSLSARFASVPRAYIVCTADRMISPAIQQRIAMATPCHPVFTLPSSHSPFFSMPEKLAACLLALAEGIQSSPELASSVHAPDPRALALSHLSPDTSAVGGVLS